MIAYLQGVVSQKNLDSATIDVNGIGYGVFMISEDLNKLTINKTSKIYIYEHIREQAHDLFGFVEQSTQKFFEQLLEVNGVGPKMALSLLSVGPTSSTRQAIAEGNVKYLQGAIGVGRRVAERVVVDLKDKVGLISAEDSTAFLQGDKEDEAQQALVGLGFSANDAAKALAGIDRKLPSEERVKLALKENK